MPDVELVKLSPKQLGEHADEYKKVRDERLAADKVVKELAAREQAIYAMLVQQMRLQEITSVGGKVATVSIPVDPENVPAVTDWSAYWQYAKENNAPEMFERRPGKAACKERWEAGEIIPGVEKFPVYKLTIKGVR
jgi:3-polyprenyl-4-hydroxybenzoate decarboxylase